MVSHLYSSVRKANWYVCTESYHQCVDKLLTLFPTSDQCEITMSHNHIHIHTETDTKSIILVANDSSACPSKCVVFILGLLNKSFDLKNTILCL